MAKLPDRLNAVMSLLLDEIESGREWTAMDRPQRLAYLAFKAALGCSDFETDAFIRGRNAGESRVAEKDSEIARLRGMVAGRDQLLWNAAERQEKQDSEIAALKVEIDRLRAQVEWRLEWFDKVATPRPWRRSAIRTRVAGISVITIGEPDKPHVILVLYGTTNDEQVTAEANAALIVAAVNQRVAPPSRTIPSTDRQNED